MATVLLPVQRVLNVPVQLWQGGADYLRGLSGALASEKAAQAQLALQAEKAARAERLERENERLRALLELRPMLQVRSLLPRCCTRRPTRSRARCSSTAARPRAWCSARR